MSKLAWRYIELTYELPGAEREQWRAAVIQAGSPDKAFERAKADTVVAHPDATNVQEFLQRTLTRVKADKILAQFLAGTWEGWPFDRETAA
jgi:hypothetical protein